MFAQSTITADLYFDSRFVAFAFDFQNLETFLVKEDLLGVTQIVAVERQHVLGAPLHAARLNVAKPWRSGVGVIGECNPK